MAPRQDAPDSTVPQDLQRTLAALREREADLTSLLRNAQDFVVYRLAMDPDAPHGGRVVLVSPSIRELLGITDPYRFPSWFENLHPEDVDRVTEANRRAWERGEPYNEVARVWHPQREDWVWVHTLSTPVFDDQGRLTHFNGLILDITQQKRAEVALQRQVAFNNLITSISTRFINLPLDAIDAGIEEALGTVGAFTEVGRSYVFLFSEDRATMRCAYEWCAEGVRPQIAHLQAVPTAALSWSNQVIWRGNVLHIPRVTDLPPAADAEREEFASQDIQSLIAVPMFYRGSVIGFLGFDAVRAPKTWSDESIKLLRIVGEIFVNALKHKEGQAALQEAYQSLEQRVRARTREIEQRRRVAESLRDILAVLNSQRSLDEILAYIVDQARQLLDTSAVAIYGLEGADAPLRIQAACGLSEAYVQRAELPLGQGAVGRAIVERRPVAMPDVRVLREEGVARTDRGDEVVVDPALVQDLFANFSDRYGALVAAPIFVAGQAYGGLAVYYGQPRHFSDDEMALVDTLADHIALAIENARLRVQAERAAVAAERNRIARELHDSVSQALYGIALGTRTARTLLDRQADQQAITDAAQDALTTPLDYVLSLADAGLAEMRALIFELRPDALDKEGLVAALSKQAEALRARHKLEVTTEFCEEPPLPFDRKEALYRVAQEASNNIVKHAHARHVTLRLTGCPDAALVLEIADDGRGFDPDGDFPGHLGLQTMRERISRVGGRLTIASAPGEGTHIRARVPIPDQRPASSASSAS